jgi:uncharacterized protein (DUF934 family)
VQRKIILDRQVVQDHWIHLKDDEDIPEIGKIVVSLHRWKEQGDALVKEGREVGVTLEGTDDARSLAGGTSALTLIVLNFDKFTDGRLYTHARVLREHLHFGGELRAVGDVLRDQLFVMARCGINAFEMRADQDLNASLQAFETFTIRYQAASDQREPLFRHRQSDHYPVDLSSQGLTPDSDTSIVKTGAKEVAYPSI